MAATNNIVTVDASRFYAKVQKLSQLTKTDLTVLLKKTMCQWIGLMQRDLFPETFSQGRNAVKADIQRVWLSPLTFVRNLQNERLKKTLRRAIAGQDFATFNALAAKTGLKLQLAEVREDIHQSRRNSRGRVTQKRANLVATSASELNAYIKKVQERVGKAKAGFLPAIRYFGHVNLPAWVTRHGTGRGRYEDTLSNNGIKGAITTINSDKAASSMNSRLRVAERTAQRIEKSLKIQIAYELRKAAQQAGLRG